MNDNYYEAGYMLRKLSPTDRANLMIDIGNEDDWDASVYKDLMEITCDAYLSIIGSDERRDLIVEQISELQRLTGIDFGEEWLQAAYSPCSPYDKYKLRRMLEDLGWTSLLADSSR